MQDSVAVCIMIILSIGNFCLSKTPIAGCASQLTRVTSRSFDTFPSELYVGKIVLCVVNESVENINENLKNSYTNIKLFRLN